MALFQRGQRTPELPSEVARRLDLGRGERILAASPDETGTWVIATTARLYAVPPAGESAAAEPVARPWHLVDAGSWDRDSFTLTVTWVDGAAANRWVFRGSLQVLAAVRERVQASVVLVEQLSFGPNRSARVVIRKNLADGSLHDQTVLGRGVRLADPDVAHVVADTRARLREQAGLI